MLWLVVAAGAFAVWQYWVTGRREYLWGVSFAAVYITGSVLTETDVPLWLLLLAMISVLGWTPYLLRHFRSRAHR